MRVLHVTTHFNVGGISNYILTLSRGLKEKGVEVVVASSGGDLRAELDRYGIPHRQLDIMTKFEFGPRVFKSAFAISGIVRDEKIDIIHAHSRVAQVASLIASKMSGAKLVTTCHGYFKKRWRKIVDTWGDKVVAISDAVRMHLVDDLGVNPSRVELIYSGVDVGKFSDPCSAEMVRQTKRELGLNDGPVIGTIGRLSSIKGQRFLVEAMKRICLLRPDAQAILLGSGDEEEPLKELAQSLGISSTIRFFRSCPDTQRFLSMMDVFVFPSVKEGLGIALLEALASGKACVASNIGGIGDIIKDGYNGVLVDVGDAGAISEAVLRLLSDEAMGKSMGQRGRELVRDRFTLNAMADNMNKLYNKVSR
jgi:Glycosyltransferase